MQKLIMLFIALALLWACKKESVTESPFETADGVNGGMLYNTFWDAETGYSQADAAKVTKLKTFSDFFRCKQCHGWDLEGTEGSYISRAPSATRPRVGIPLRSKITSYTNDQLFEAIKKSTGRRPFSYDHATYNATTNATMGDQMPDYSTLLSDAQIWNLVKFLKQEAFNVKDLYDYTATGTYPTGKITYANIGKDGDATKGKTTFATKGCNTSSCHGTNGTARLVDNNTYTLGGFVKAKPNEAQHKIAFGQLEGSGMSPTKLTVSEMKDLYKALSDTLAFPLKP